MKRLALVLFSVILVTSGMTADWTQWRFDEHRMAVSPDTLPTTLYLQWRRDLPSYVDDQTIPYYNENVDVNDCRPVQLGKMLFVPTIANDCITAYDTDTGVEKWRYYAGGVLRRPPAAAVLTGGARVVIFGCDDGYVYCLNADNGSEKWKFLAAPNNDKAMVFKRLGSTSDLLISPLKNGATRK